MNDRHSPCPRGAREAVSDLTAAQRLLELTGPYDAVCFHAQQACEKTLKAVLAIAVVQIQRTHNLEELLAECEGVLEPGLPSSLSDLGSCQ